jgi:DNA recombination protein RmuC
VEASLIVLAAAVVVAAVILSRRPAGPGFAAGAEAEAIRALRSRVDEAVASLASLSGVFDERRRLEEQAVDALGRVERLVAGSHGRGRSGENLLGAALAEFPPEMLVRDFTLGGRVCEFALRMPDGKLLPIDSKWPASDLVAALATAEGPALEEIRRRVEKAVCLRVGEVAGYLDPSLTVPMAVAAVPDAVFGCCRKAHAVAQQSRVLIVSYSLAVPLLLGMWNLYRTYAGEVDEAQLHERVHEIAVILSQLGDRIESQLSRGLKMASNAAAEMRSLVRGAELSLGALGGGNPAPGQAGSLDHVGSLFERDAI